MGESSSRAKRTVLFEDFGLLEEELIDSDVLIIEAILEAALFLETFLRTPISSSWWVLMWRAAKKMEISSCS